MRQIDQTIVSGLVNCFNKNGFVSLLTLSLLWFIAILPRKADTRIPGLTVDYSHIARVVLYSPGLYTSNIPSHIQSRLYTVPKWQQTG